MSVVDAISKAFDADPVGASALIDEVVYSYLSDAAEALRPELEALISANAAQNISVAKRQLGRQYVASVADGTYPDEEVHKYAKWLSDLEAVVIGKSEYVEGETPSGAKYRVLRERNSRGQFMRGIAPQAKAVLVTSADKGKLSPHTEPFMEQNDKGKWSLTEEGKANRERLEIHQGQYEQAKRIATQIMSDFSSGEKPAVDLLLSVQNPENGNAYQIVVPGSDFKANGFDEALRQSAFDFNQNLVSVSVAPAPDADDKLRNKIAAYNTLGVTNSQALANLATLDPERVSALASTFQRGYGQNKSGLGRFFDRLMAGSKVLEQLPGGQKYADFARFAGTFGPQAEEVLGPYAKQAAYRYRGTEKEPDLMLNRQFSSSPMKAGLAAVARGDQDAEAKIRSMASVRGADLTVRAINAQMDSLARERGGRFTPDELTLNVRNDVAARYLIDRLPTDPFVADVSEKSGQVLPSQGLLIDRDGDVVSEAVGFADDHYLPFDLKNLTSLHGGQYVRTRVSGGLTAEDIYTATRLGARMVSVVSASGVFTLEMDPNFRGGRAMNDKARSMYDRYIKILDAVDGSGLYAQDLAPREKAEIMARARQMSGGDKDKFDSTLKDLMNERRRKKMMLDNKTLADLETKAREIVDAERVTTKYNGSAYSRRIEEVYNELEAQEQSKVVSELRLNAEGYKVALETLQAQFPYYIRNVSWRPLKDTGNTGGFLESLGESPISGMRQRLAASDRGYVRPTDLRPNSVRSGYYRQGSEKYLKQKNEAERTEGGSEAPKATGGAGSAKTTSDSAEPAAKPVVATPEARAAKSALADAVKVARQKFSSISDEIDQWNDADGMTWDDVKGDEPSSEAIGFIFSRRMQMLNAKHLQNLVDTDPVGLANMLSDPEVIRLGVMNHLNSDLLGERGLDVDEFVEAAQTFGEAINNFVDETFAYGGDFDPADPFNAGRFPTPDAEIRSLKTQADLNAYASSSEEAAEVVEMADYYLTDGEPDSVADVRDGFTADLQALESIKEAVNTVLENGEEETIESVERHTEANIADVMGDVEFSDLTDEALENRARLMQNAWGLVQAMRFMGGGADPKVAKAETPRSSRQVRVVKSSDPLALEVARRRAAGMPFVPTKLTR